MRSLLNYLSKSLPRSSSKIATYVEAPHRRGTLKVGLPSLFIMALTAWKTISATRERIPSHAAKNVIRLNQNFH